MTIGPPPRVLIVAGSDSGGGAGVQGDIKTVTTLGGYAATAITAITVQDTTRVHDIDPVAPDIVRKQMKVVLSDIGADAIKTGMLGDAATVRAVAEEYEARGAGAPLIVDPVMVATSGDRLAAHDAVSALKDRLTPLAALVTPNIPEAEVLIGGRIRTIDEMIEAARVILTLGARAVLVKGGHLTGDTITDVLVEGRGDAPNLFRNARVDSRNTHGTGCALASAIAVELGRGRALAEAVETARTFVRRAIATAPGFGKGAGPLSHSAHPEGDPPSP